METAMIQEMKSDLDTLHGKYLTFWTEGQLYGIPIADVVQIIGMQEITSIPEFPYYAKGIINLRGTIIPLIDVRLRFGKPEIEYTDRTCTIVALLNGNDIGFIVDSVDEVTDIQDEQISPPPKLSAGDRASAFVTGIGKLENRVVLLIEAARLGSDDVLGYTE